MNFDKAGESLAAGDGSRAGEMASRRAWAGVRAVKSGEHGPRGSGGTAGSHRISSEGCMSMRQASRGRREQAGTPGDTTRDTTR